MTNATEPHDNTAEARRIFLLCFLGPTATLVLAVCVLPPAVFRLSYGRGPLTADPHAVHTGMSQDDVFDLLGSPHETPPGSATWFYYTDALKFGFFSVDFGQDGRVVDTHEPW
jgi:outer membrane protein assembly factor BamE (lipoprotein component of BamABCDE complex)